MDTAGRRGERGGRGRVAFCCVIAIYMYMYIHVGSPAFNLIATCI